MNEKATLARLIGAANTTIVHKTVLSNSMTQEEKRRTVTTFENTLAKLPSKENYLLLIMRT